MSMRWIISVAVLVRLVTECVGDGIVDMLSPFMNLAGLAEEASYASGGGVTDSTLAPIDDTYPLAPVEVSAIMQMYHECRTPQSMAMRTWCTGDDNDSYLNDEQDTVALCPRGVQTHPCTGRVLHSNRPHDDDRVEFFWPWEGIKCDAYTEPTTITHIYLSGENLRCQLSELDLSVMVSLEQLDLSRNQLHGRFPEWLGDMTMLRLLNLQGNQLKGDIPSYFANNGALELINLSGNLLTAQALNFFDAFKRLQHLDLSQNAFVKELSASLFASEFLQTINLSHNAFRDKLPELPVFQYITSLDMSSNQLTGKIPAQLSLWGREDPHDPDENSILAVFDVSKNLFTGELPVISNLTSLRRLDVSNNNFSGAVPEFPPQLLNHVKPADFAGNAFLCPLPSALLPSNLTCVCGDGYESSNYDSDDNLDVILPANEAMEHCVRCPGGLFSNTTTFQKCRPCHAGSASATPSHERADRCELCLPGTFANTSGRLACSPCPAGTFGNDVGTVSCTLCIPGEFAAGQSSANCSLCPKGTFSDSRGATACSQCPPGSYTDVEGEAKCQLCPTGTYQDEVGSVTCEECPVGFVARYPGHSRCLPCPCGSFYREATKTCQLCSPGTFSEAEAQTACRRCEDGTVAGSYGSEKYLEVAEAGWGYASSEPETIAVKCASGTFNDGKWRTCQPCPPGMFAENPGSRVCSSCAKGSFASSESSSRCEKAPAGSFVDEEGSTRAKLCSPNYVASTSGSIVCTPCVLPSFSFLGGGINCSIAEIGEIYEHVEWPRLALAMVGVELNDFEGEQNESFGNLLQSWTDTLAGYSTSVRQLHVLEVSQYPAAGGLLEIVVAVEKLSSFETHPSDIEKTASDAAHAAVNEAETALDELLNEFGFSGTTDDGEELDEDQQLTELVTTDAFREALTRQFGFISLLNATLSPSMLNVSIVEPPFNSTRAVACPPGTFFSLSEDANNGSDSGRDCRSCPAGSFVDTTGAFACEPCPRHTSSAVKGAAACTSCPSGADAAPGATSCVECSWFTYVCEGFWIDVTVAACIGALLVWKICKKVRRLCEGDRILQEQIESEALLTAVRAHGRTFDGVRYAPMGVVSADTMDRS